VLSAYTGPLRITKPNTVIDGKTLGCIEIDVPGVIIRNSKVSCAGPIAVRVDDQSLYEKSPPLLIEDSEIDCKNRAGSHGVSEAHFTIRRVEITLCENGLDVNQRVVVEDSYIHNLASVGADPHEDGIQLAYGHWNGSGFVCCAVNVTIRHNTIYGMSENDRRFGTSAIISNKTGPDVNVLIDNNLMGGGAYTLYCDQQEITGVNYRVINNHFSTRFSAKAGFYGIATDCSDEQQLGNVNHETGQPLRLR